jgi:hypothetical protein
MKNLLFTMVFLLFLGFTGKGQNVGINDDNSSPKVSAMLDVNSSSKGLLIPRVGLSATNSASPVTTTPETSLLVYNTATTGTAPNNVIPGYYYWNGSSWIGLSDGLATAPYGSYLDLTDQVTAENTTAYPVKFSVNDAQYGFTHSAGTSAITATYTGKYLITFSGVFQSSTNNRTFNVWLRVNGANYANSNTKFAMLGTAQNRVVTVTYIIPLTAGQYFELVMQSDDSAAKLDYTAAQTTPDRPACPSIILTVNKISN